jgi:Flp pilus assembly protein TadD
MMYRSYLIVAGLALALALQSLQAQEKTPRISIDEVQGKTGYTQPMNITSNMVEQLSRGGKDQTDLLSSAGTEYADEGDFEAAERAYKRALEMDPDNQDILLRLGALYVSMDQYGDAVESFNKLIELNAENSMAHNNLGWCYAVGPGVRNVELALRHSREALLLAPDQPSVWNTLAEAYYVAGDYKKALRSADQAILLLRRMLEMSEESLRSFEVQRAKILRAEQALKMFEGTLELDN